MEWNRFITKMDVKDGRKLDPLRVCMTVTFILALVATLFYLYLAVYIFLTAPSETGIYAFLFKEVLTVNLLTLLWSVVGGMMAKAAQDSHIKSKTSTNQNLKPPVELSGTL